ncbi:MAG TPA: universal stress protein [Polyangia bacterium]|jgi:nucleotide-binding universal stress UspA family protein
MDPRSQLTVGQARITRILHPTDFSPGSTLALDYAVLLARLTGAELHLLHVVVPPEEVATSESALRKAVREAAKRLDALCATVTGVPSVHAATRVGSSAGEVIRYARDEEADLVVMGTTGAHGGEAPVGSVAEKVVRGLTVPVLAVKAAAPGKAKAAGRRCSLCGAPATDVICDACKDRVRGEAAVRRRG